MNRSIGRVAALLGAGALALAVVTPAFAAEPLTGVPAVDSGTPDAGKAWVRVLHGSPDAPPVDVYANDGEILADVPFGVISDYLPVPAGPYNIKVCVAGSDASVAANCVINADLTFADGTKTTVAATNDVANIEAKVLVDAPGANADQALVRVVHFSADTPAVDVLTDAGDPTGITGLTYPNATDYLPLAAGAYDLKVCATADTSVCPLDLPELDLAAGTAYSVFAVGSLAATVEPEPTPTPTPEAPAPTTAPGVTTPPTSTIAPTTEGGSSNGSMLAILAILGVAGLVTVGMSRRFATRRVEK